MTGRARARRGAGCLRSGVAVSHARGDVHPNATPNLLHETGGGSLGARECASLSGHRLSPRPCDPVPDTRESETRCMNHPPYR